MLRPGTGHSALALRFRLTAMSGFGYDMDNVEKTNGEKIHGAPRALPTANTDTAQSINGAMK